VGLVVCIGAFYCQPSMMCLKLQIAGKWDRIAVWFIWTVVIGAAVCTIASAAAGPQEWSKFGPWSSLVRGKEVIVKIMTIRIVALRSSLAFLGLQNGLWGRSSNPEETLAQIHCE
jgi:hypothetical protein